MSNVSRGFAYEREVKQHFVDAGWGCTRAAHSASAMDLIAFVKRDDLHKSIDGVFRDAGYTLKLSKSEKIPLTWVYIKTGSKYTKKVYWDSVHDNISEWAVVLMQCKIRKR